MLSQTLLKGRITQIALDLVLIQQEHPEMQPKAKCSSLDRISNLPQNILETILCFVPIKDAVRTSILSRSWRFNWVTIPKLVFSEKDMFDKTVDENQLSILEEGPSERKQLTRRCKLFYAIYQVLLLHDGPILDVTLNMGADDSCVEIDQIIHHLSRKNTVKKFKLDLFHQLKYYLPLAIFSLHQLTELYLSFCNIYFEPTFSGFASLTRLTMIFVRTCKSTLLHLLSSCPALKRFSLLLGGEPVDESDTDLDLFKSLPVIEHLSIFYQNLRCLAKVPDPREFPAALAHLKYFRLYGMMSIEKYQFHYLHLLMRNSPNLEYFKIRIDPDTYFKEPDRGVVTMVGNFEFEHLKVLKFLNFVNLKLELEFVQLILAKSPVLKKVCIILYTTVTKDEGLKICKILADSPRASPLVDIIVKDPHEEED